jgi:hypothetical protein
MAEWPLKLAADGLSAGCLNLAMIHVLYKLSHHSLGS